MKFLISTILTALLAFVLGLYLPWWSIAIAAFIAGILVRQRPLASFLAGFIGVLLLWAALATWIDYSNGHILASRVSQLFGLSPVSGMIILISAVIGGLIGGMAALTGSFLIGTRKRTLKSA